MISEVNRRYNRSMYEALVNEYYDHSDFHNLGYWRPGTQSQKAACEDLMRVLLDSIPDKRGRILDVACGKGATTRALLRYYAPADTVGINISPKQLETCRANVPGCTFLLMDATKLGFRTASFENIICVEAACDFQSREDFLREACRVLKPGGRLVLSDILRSVDRQMNGADDMRRPRNVPEYRAMCLRSGLRDVKLVDATTECWTRFYGHCARYLRHRLLLGKLTLRAFGRLMTALDWMNLTTTHYLLVSAEKPVLRETTRPAGRRHEEDER